ncbi:T9SS type A sorting domain-containing protein [Aureispira anguillae]|uniref:T9SS type A sorting domain-containing protein n=1 Tax=Aureispira anguillae TaxID=2864201 RepID=A0A915YL48_9BACT|nr:T9SS type A sorting domain-containing protein [Aureispira anguillae]BDS15227.1 T9SS type A sorting domain-containing protein [Aureispira anguillae]
MKNLIISFLTYMLFIAPIFSQYNTSGGLLTINTPSSPQDNSIGALGPETIAPDGRPINYYAISSQYSSSSGNQCWRNIKFFKGEGILIATSSNYSHDHLGKTKIIFDPNNGKVVYALYQERYSTTGSPAIFQTFVKRFELNTSNNTIMQSSRFHVFNFQRSADFVIAPNGDLLVGSPMNDGAVHIKAIRYANGSFTHLNTFITSQPGEAYSNSLQGHTWWLSMDMKGNTIAIAHNKGTYNNRSIKLKTGTYIAPTVPNTGALPLIHEYNFNGQSLHHSNALYQSLGLRPNGDILYLMNEANNTNWKLVKVDPTDYSTSVITNGSGSAHLAVSENNMAFLAKVTSGTFTLEKFNDHDIHEHTYTLAWQIDNGIKHLTVRDCKILSCGREQDYTQYHELYECSDCNEATATTQAEFTNQEYNTIVDPTFYGPQEVAVYCKWSDVTIDASASTCENSVRLSICEIDLSTWTTSPDMFNGVICTNCTAAHDIKPVDYVYPSAGYNFPSKYYLATITTGPGGNPVYKLFKFDICERPRTSKLETFSERSKPSTPIYPNPTSGVVNVQFEDIKSASTIQVFNSLGQMILQKEVKGQVTTEVDLGKYNSGIYTIQIVTGNEKRIEKVIKQ